MPEGPARAGDAVVEVPVHPIKPVYGGKSFVLSQYSLPHISAVDQLGLHRAYGDEAFSAAEHRLVRLFHTELGRLWKRDVLRDAGIRGTICRRGFRRRWRNCWRGGARRRSRPAGPVAAHDPQLREGAAPAVRGVEPRRAAGEGGRGDQGGLHAEAEHHPAETAGAESARKE